MLHRVPHEVSEVRLVCPSPALNGAPRKSQWGTHCGADALEWASESRLVSHRQSASLSCPLHWTSAQGHSPCPPRKRAQPMCDQGSCPGRQRGGQGGDRDGNKDWRQDVWGDWGRNGECLFPEGCASRERRGWQVGEWSSSHFHQQVSPGCVLSPAQSPVPIHIPIWSQVLHLSCPPHPSCPILPPLLPFLISHIPLEAWLSGEPSAADSSKHCLVLSQRYVPCLCREHLGWGPCLLLLQLEPQ